MSVVILGGNECMVRQYMDICDTFSCKAKVYPKMSACMKKIGSPDLLILFTGTVSHKMIKCALNDIKGKKTTSVIYACFDSIRFSISSKYSPLVNLPFSTTTDSIRSCCPVPHYSAQALFPHPEWRVPELQVYFYPVQSCLLYTSRCV